MPKVIERKETEIKSVWANGENIHGPYEAVSPPTGDSPYWKIILISGDTCWVTGQVTVKQGLKNPLESLSDEKLENRIKALQKKKV